MQYKSKDNNTVLHLQTMRKQKIREQRYLYEVSELLHVNYIIIKSINT